MTQSLTAQIKVPDKVALHDPIVCTSEGDSDIYLWSHSDGLKSVQDASGKRLYLWGPKGKYEVRLTTITVIVDWEAETKQVSYKEHKADIVIGDPGPGPGPGPDPPGPEPDIPDDKYDNVGRQVAKWAAELNLDKTQEIAKNYQEAADRLLGKLTPPLPTIDLAVSFITQANNKISKNDEAWKQWAAKTDAPWKKHVTDRDSAAGFMSAVATGLRGVK